MAGKWTAPLDDALSRVDEIEKDLTGKIRTYSTGEFAIRLLISVGALYFGFNIAFTIMMGFSAVSDLIGGLIAIAMLVGICAAVYFIVRFVMTWLRAQRDQRASSPTNSDP